MPSFSYRALASSGRVAKGRLDAHNELDLEARLRAMGMDLVSARRLSKRGVRSQGSNVGRRARLALCLDLEQIVRAGLPLLEGLRELAMSYDAPPMRAMLATLAEDIERGSTLSEAMSKFPRAFDPVFISLVRAGEQSGRLDEILEGLSRSLRWQDELASQTKKLLIYPTLVCIVVLFVGAFLFTYLVPQVVSLLRTMGGELPLQTRALIAASGHLARWGWLYLALPAIVGIGLAWGVKVSSRLRLRCDRWKLCLPVIGTILGKIVIARFASVFALMYRSGIGILDALRTSESIVGNRAIAQALEQAGSRIRAGSRLSDGFADLDAFPPLVLRMLRMGETTGALDKALSNVNYFYERDVRESIDRALKAIEPALTLVLGGMLALILFAVLTPIYEVIGRIKI